MPTLRVYNKTANSFSFASIPSSQVSTFEFSDFSLRDVLGNKAFAAELANLIAADIASATLDGVYLSPVTAEQAVMSISDSTMSLTLYTVPVSLTAIELRSVPSYNSLGQNAEATVVATGTVYYFDAASTATDDGVAVIKPDDRDATIPGRWLPAVVGGTAPSGVTVSDEGVVIPGSFSNINFVGAGVTAIDGGGGSATVTIPGVAGPVALAGDLSGNTGAANVIRLQNRTLVATAPTNGQALVWNNGSSQWEPATVAAAGAAGGDLGGTYPNPTVTDLTITGEAQGSVLFRNATNWAQLAPGTANHVLTTAGAGADPSWTSGSALAIAGDVSGTLAATTVTDLTISGETHGDLLYRNATNWVRLAPGTPGDVLTTQGAAAPTWTTVSGATFPLKYVVDQRFGGSPPAGAYSTVTTALTAANAGTKPALIQVYDGTYALGGSVLSVNGGVTIAGMGSNPTSVILQGMLNWDTLSGGGLANLAVQAQPTDTGHTVTVSSGSSGTIWTAHNVYLSNLSTTPDRAAFFTTSPLNASAQILLSNVFTSSSNGPGVIQESGAVQSRSSNLATDTPSTKFSYDLVSGEFKSYGDVFEGPLRLAGANTSLLNSVINASTSAASPALTLIGPIALTLSNPLIESGAGSAYWITATVPVAVTLNGLGLRSGSNATHADPNVNFSSGQTYEPSRVISLNVAGVGSYPSKVNSVNHSPGADFDALTLPAQGFVVGGTLLYVQNISTTFISRLTQGTSTTIAGGATYDLRPGESAILVYESATSDYRVVTTRLLFGGDLDYGATVGTQTVIGLQGLPLSATAPTPGQFVGWDDVGGTWEPTNQTPLRFIVDKTLAASPNTPAGYYQDLEAALTAANSAATATQQAIVSVYPGQYTTASARFSISNYVTVQGMSSDPLTVEIQKPVRFASGAVVASLNNVYVNQGTNEDSLSFYQSSSTITLRNCKVRNTDVGNSKGVGRIDTNGSGSTLNFIDCDLYAADYDTVRLEFPGTVNFVRGTVECARADAAKLAVSVSNGAATVKWQDTVFLGAVQQSASDTISLQGLRGEINLEGNASVPVQFGGPAATVLATSFLRSTTIRTGSANETIYSGVGGVIGTLLADDLLLPNVGTIGDFVRPLYTERTAPMNRVVGGGNATLSYFDRTVYSENAGTLTLPDIVLVQHGTIIEVTRDAVSGSQTVGVASGNYLDNTLNGTLSQAADTNIRYAAYRVGFTNPTWISMK